MTTTTIAGSDRLRRRRHDIASEVQRLNAKLWSLSAEDQELAAAERVMFWFDIDAGKTNA